MAVVCSVPDSSYDWNHEIQVCSGLGHERFCQFQKYMKGKLFVFFLGGRGMNSLPFKHYNKTLI